MTRVLDCICKLRDVLENKDYKMLAFHRRTIQTIFDEVTRHVKRKGKDYKYELDFTSQDLRELAQDISDTFKRWDQVLNPEKNIKRMMKEDLKDRCMNLNPYLERAIPVMEFRRDYGQVLTELRSIIEHHAIFLYFLEEASKDEFALKYTKRF